MGASTDPYRQNGHELGQWMAEMVTRYLRPGARVHCRGFHYVLVATAAVIKPDGTLYQNTNDDWEWLLNKVTKAARWLGYVSFDRIADARNEPPRIYDDPPEAGEPQPTFRPIRADVTSGAMVYVPLSGDRVGFSSDARAALMQPFRVVLIGEKSSLAEVLGPIARLKAAELLLPTGDISDTMLFEMAERASRDGRPLVVLYFSDFDPSGYAMPNAVARKLQALRDLLFPDLQIKGVYGVALTAEQCREHDLPESVLKDNEKRAGAWIAKWGRQQTEIDALAALRPDVLRQIAEDALRPFYDPTLDQRQAELDSRYRDAVKEWQAAGVFATDSLRDIRAADLPDGFRQCGEVA
jgi:hypothetical protein